MWNLAEYKQIALTSDGNIGAANGIAKSATAEDERFVLGELTIVHTRKCLFITTKCPQLVPRYTNGRSCFHVIVHVYQISGTGSQSALCIMQRECLVIVLHGVIAQTSLVRANISHETRQA